MDEPGVATPRHTGNRYGRSAAAHRAVLQAADDLVVAQGFAAVTIEGIAKAAGVSKQTIYRWWSSKSDILFDVLDDYASRDLVAPDTGDLAADLQAHAADVTHFLFVMDEGAVYRALLGQAQHDPAVAAEFAERFHRPQRERDAAPLRQAIARGELPPDFDIDAALDAVLGPLYFRSLTGAAAPDVALLRRLVRSVLDQPHP